MRSVDESEVARVLTPAAARELMRATLAASAEGRAHGPPRAVLALGGAWLGAMPAVVDLGDLCGLGAKIVTAFPRNAEVGAPTHQAVVILFGPATGEPLALVGAETITTLRTAAVSVVATERLARRPRGTLAILGAGVQGRAHLRAFVDAGLAERVRVWSPTPSRAEALAQLARDAGIAGDAEPDAATCVRGADVIVTVTAASQPILSAEDVADGAHVNAVGACVADRRELPAALVGDAAVYVDSLAGAEREAGDLLLAARDLGIERIAIDAELGQMLADPKRAIRAARVTLFKSLGLGIEDVACAAYVLERAAQRNSAETPGRTTGSPAAS